uniref:Uncharacterized protein n=1 Tax=Sparus aurata TaxID=8175 RepID=A0A671UD99_SPAAU
MILLAVWPLMLTSVSQPHYPLSPMKEDWLLTMSLDTEKPESEPIVKTKKSCLTRGDFWTLGLKLEMESTVGSHLQYFPQGKCNFVVDLYAVPTWRQPTACNPLPSLPVSIPFTVHTYVFSNFRNLSQSVSPGPWKETTGLEIEVPLYGSDCGIFMLMYALYTVLDGHAGFAKVVVCFAHGEF